MTKSDRPAAHRARRGRNSAEAIIDVAEDMWGQRGLDAVSLREITAEAGLANPASVQYHFGDKAGLIAAIFAKSLPAIDAERARMLAIARGQGLAEEPRVLLDCLFRPLVDQRNAGGRRSYAAFLREVLQSTEAASLREKAMAITPATAEVLRHIDAVMPALLPALARQRMIAINLLMLTVIDQLDRDLIPGLSPEQVYADALTMATHALVSPPA